MSWIGMTFGLFAGFVMGVIATVLAFRERVRWLTKRVNKIIALSDQRQEEHEELLLMLNSAMTKEGLEEARKEFFAKFESDECSHTPLSEEVQNRINELYKSQRMNIVARLEDFANKLKSDELIPGHEIAVDGKRIPVESVQFSTSHKKEN